MFEGLMFFVIGTLTFCIGLATGWGMRGSVKEEEVYKYNQIRDELERQKHQLSNIYDNTKEGK